MLTDRMTGVAQAVQNQILTVFPAEYLQQTLSGKITLKDIILQILVECCKYAYDNTQEKHSLDYYLGGAASVDDSEKMQHQRTLNYIKEKRKILDKQLRAEGWIVDGMVLKDMKDVEEKKKGYSINEFQFWETCNVHDMRLVKDVVNREIGNKNYSTQKLQEISDEYDNFVNALRDDWNGNNKKPLFDFLAMFTLEWKYSFDFYYEISEFMVGARVKTMPDVKNRIGLFTSPQTLYSELLLTHPEIFPRPTLAESRMIVARRKYIDDIIMADAHSFELVKRQFAEALVIMSAILNQMTLEGIPIREWFVKKTEPKDWISAFKEYDVFQAFISPKQMDKKKTRIIKDIYNIMSLDYKNPDFRS